MLLDVPEHLARIAGRVDLDRLATARVVAIGLGTVGSPIVAELAACGVRAFLLVDGQTFEAENLPRHALDVSYVGMNKAEAMAAFILKSYPPPPPTVEAVPTHVDDAMSNKELDRLIDGADVVIAATDDRMAQRRVAERALANDVPAVFPALYENGGGEVFVSLGPGAPCLLCWEAFRPANADLRAVSALNVEALSVVALAVQLAIGVLDPTSSFARSFAPAPRERAPRTLFVLTAPFAALQYATVPRRANCPMCQVGPTDGRRAESVDVRQQQAWSRDPTQIVQENPAFGVAAALTFIVFVIALATGHALATFFLTLLVLATVGLFFRPSWGDVVARAEASDGGGLLAALVLLGLFISALASGNAIVILLFTVALLAASLALAWGSGRR